MRVTLFSNLEIKLLNHIRKPPLSNTHTPNRYYSQMYLSHLLLVSPHKVSKRLFEKILSHMLEFFKTCTMEEIVQCEESAQIGWNSLLLILRLCFIPNSPKQRSPTAKVLDPHSYQLIQLQGLGLESTMFALGCMLSRKQYTIETELREYVTCMPWHVPPSYLPRAKEILGKLGGTSLLSPPRLKVITKAKLAKMHFGLDGVVGKEAEAIQKEVFSLSAPAKAERAPAKAAAPPPKPNPLLYVLALQ